METYDEKIENLEERIRVIDEKILELTQVKLNLMMLSRDFNQQMCKTTLEECFTDELKEMLNNRLHEEKS